MPPKVRFPREAVIRAALDVAREGGMEALNARSIAHKLGCSTQPLYRELRNMDELKRAVYQEAARLFSQRLVESPSDDVSRYKAVGLALLRFSDEEKALYRLLFLRDRSQDAVSELERGFSDANEAAYNALMQANGYTLDEAKAFHLHMFIYIHGLAAMIATGYIPYVQRDCSALLTEEYEALKRLFDEKRSSP